MPHGCRRAARTWPLVIVFLLGSCATPFRIGLPAEAGEIAGNPAGGTLTVFAAASLTEAFTEIGEVFMGANPRVRVNFSFGGSQQLAQQLGQGAPADIFASADDRQMRIAIQSGRVSSESPRIFALNALIVALPGDNPARIQTLEDLARGGVKVVIAAPEVPAGGYTQAFLEQAGKDPRFGPGYQGGVLANVVSYEENVRAVLTKVVLGEADAGIVYSSDLAAARQAGLGHLEIPPELNQAARYLIAPLQDSHVPELGAQFIEMVLSPVGQAILADYGYLPADPAAPAN